MSATTMFLALSMVGAALFLIYEAAKSISEEFDFETDSYGSLCLEPRLNTTSGNHRTHFEFSECAKQLRNQATMMWFE